MASSGDDIDIEQLRNRQCYAGLDLAQTEDVCAFVMVFPFEDGSLKVLPYFFVSESAVERRRNQTGGSYDNFVSRGELIVTDGNSTDYDVIKNKIIECAEAFEITSIAYDRWNSNVLINQLSDAGIMTDPFGQGFISMTAPIKNAEVLIKKQKLHHGSNAMLRWMISNVVVKKDDAENVKFSKSKAGDKIDGVVALIMALGEKMTIEKSDHTSTSVYEESEIRFL
jgi:phage terminase large subunit-like protein